MAAFEYRQAEEIRDALAAHGARYLFIGKSGAVLLGFPDTTQDANIFVERSEQNGLAVVAGLRDLGFALTSTQEMDIEGFLVCHPDDIIASKEATHRRKDLESLPRLRAFRDYWKQTHR